MYYIPFCTTVDLIPHAVVALLYISALHVSCHLLLHSALRILGLKMYLWSPDLWLCNCHIIIIVYVTAHYIIYTGNHLCPGVVSIYVAEYLFENLLWYIHV